MLLPHLLALTLALVPPLASAAIFPKGTHVKMLDAKGFKKAMKRNETSVVAFVAPWCGHCQNMAPEYSKAAKSLHPMVPLYAVDCDAEPNKRLCGEQGVQGFPTIKLYPRGNQKPPVSYDAPTRTASAFFHWASRLVPNNVKKLSDSEEITNWASKKPSKPRALLLTKDKKIPLLWQVLSNKYAPRIQFGSHHDPKGRTSKSMGLIPEANNGESEKKGSKVVVYPADSTVPAVYEGVTKFESLSKFFNSVLDGTADLKVVNEEVKVKESAPVEDIGIQQKEAEPAAPTDEQEPQGTKDSAAPEVPSQPEETKTGQDEQVVFEAAAETQSASVVDEPEATKRAEVPPVEEPQSQEAERPKDEL